MITFKTLLETVYEPKSGDEKNFKAKHIVAKYKTPYDTESQFTSTATKAKRKADYDAKEDEQVYEAMDPVGKHDADIDNDGDVDKSDKYLIARRKAIGKAIRKESVELDEVSKKTLGSYIKKASTDQYLKGQAVQYHTNKANSSTGSAFEKESKKKHMDAADNNLRKVSNRDTGIGRAVNRLTKEEVELDEAKTDVYHKHMLKALGKTRLPKDHPYTSSIANNGDFVVYKGNGIAGRIPKGEHNLKEAVELDEAFKIGAMKLKDGSTVNLTRESVDMFNKLFKQLNAANKAKMEERMLSGKSGFQEILGFAENI